MEITLVLNEDLIWQNDYNGYETGFKDVNIVGIYQLNDTDVFFYIDMETGKILQWVQSLREDD